MIDAQGTYSGESMVDQGLRDRIAASERRLLGSLGAPTSTSGIDLDRARAEVATATRVLADATPGSPAADAAAEWLAEANDHLATFDRP